MDPTARKSSRSRRKSPRRRSRKKYDDDSSLEETVQRSLKLDDDLRKRLMESLPEALEFIEKLQNIVTKQVKKIVKWKKKVKELQEKDEKHASTQTPLYKNEVVETSTEKDAKQKSVADDIREAAEQVMQSNGFVYEETSGLYYDYNSGYYYNAEYGLYYDGTTGTYLEYNQDTQTYVYHSQVELETTKRKPKKSKRKITDNYKNTKGPKKLKHKDDQRDEEDLEDGECLSEDDNSSVASDDVSKQWPPCMRVIVEATDIPKIKPGSLFIITCDGGTVGREGDHSICLPDINVSKHHLKVTYDPVTTSYTVVDLGSRNGTIINGKRLSSSKQESEPVTIVHGSKIQLGSTTLLCHIHEGSQTCGNCEPGLLIEDQKDSTLASNGQSVGEQFKSELRRLKKQHGFLGWENEKPIKLGDGYTDRAEKRRHQVGSQNPYEKTAAASVNESISSENKGFKLLSKMGWKEGQTLGKDGTSGLTEPVQLVSNVGTSGMGADCAVVPVKKDAKRDIWKKTQERFEKLPEVTAMVEVTDSD